MVQLEELPVGLGVGEGGGEEVELSLGVLVAGLGVFIEVH